MARTSLEMDGTLDTALPMGGLISFQELNTVWQFFYTSFLRGMAHKGTLHAH